MQRSIIPYLPENFRFWQSPLRKCILRTLGTLCRSVRTCSPARTLSDLEDAAGLCLNHLEFTILPTAEGPTFTGRRAKLTQGEIQTCQRPTGVCQIHHRRTGAGLANTCAEGVCVMRLVTQVLDSAHRLTAAPLPSTPKMIWRYRWKPLKTTAPVTSCKRKVAPRCEPRKPT